MRVKKSYCKFKEISFALYDTGETILSALVFSTFFPLYISSHLDTKIYSFLYGLTFLLSFFISLWLGKYADKTGERKQLFILFTLLATFSTIMIFGSVGFPVIALFFFLLTAFFHQQAFVFYNSLLADFSQKGFVSGLGVSFGYIGSAITLIFFTKMLHIPDVFLISGLIFLLLSLPSFFFLKNPELKSENASILKVLKDKKFLILIISILTLTEVANTMIAMMGIYLKFAYNLDNIEIYRVIGFSSIGGIIGGVLWGILSSRFNIWFLYFYGFIFWILFFIFLPLVSSEFLFIMGFFAGFFLAHLWTLSRLLIIEGFPNSELSLRLSFLSLTERIASSSGLILWSILLLLTNNNYKLSASLIGLIPVIGLILFFRLWRSKDKTYTSY